MPVAIEVYVPDKRNWKLGGLVTPADEFVTFKAISKGQEVIFEVSCEKDDSMGRVRRITPRRYLILENKAFGVYERGKIRTRAELYRGWSHHELLQPSEGGSRTLVRFTQL